MAAAASSTKLIALRRLLLPTLKPISTLYSSSSSISRSLLSPLCVLEPSNYSTPPLSRTFSSSGPSGIDSDASTGPLAVDYRHVYVSILKWILLLFFLLFLFWFF